MVRRADLVIDNYRPGVLERLGIHYDDLVAVKPDVITLSTTGFGEGGPLSHRPGFDPVFQAMSGIMKAQGGDSDPGLLRPPGQRRHHRGHRRLRPWPRLHHRDRTGEGQRTWTSLAGNSCLAQSGELVRYPGRPPAPLGGRDFLGPGPLDRFYQTADGWIRVQATAPDGRARLAAAGVLPEGGGPADDDRPGRRHRRLPRRHAAGRGARPPRRAPASPPPGPASCSRSSTWRRSSAIEAVIEGRMGPRPHFHPFRLVRFSRTEVPSIAPVSPGLGEHSREVLLDHGFDEERVAALLDAGVISIGPPLDLSTYKA